MTGPSDPPPPLYPLSRQGRGISIWDAALEAKESFQRSTKATAQELGRQNATFKAKGKNVDRCPFTVIRLPARAPA